MLEIIQYTSQELVLQDNTKAYSYFGVLPDLKDRLVRLCRQNRRGEVFNILKSYSSMEKVQYV